MRSSVTLVHIAADSQPVPNKSGIALAGERPNSVRAGACAKAIVDAKETLVHIVTGEAIAIKAAIAGAHEAVSIGDVDADSVPVTLAPGGASTTGVDEGTLHTVPKISRVTGAAERPRRVGASCDPIARGSRRSTLVDVDARPSCCEDEAWEAGARERARCIGAQRVGDAVV